MEADTSPWAGVAVFTLLSRSSSSRVSLFFSAGLRLLDSHEKHLARLLGTQMQQAWTLWPSQVVDASLEHAVFLLADRPGRELRLLVDRSEHLRGRIKKS